MPASHGARPAHLARAALLFLALAPGAASAAQPMTGSEFDAYSLGKTLLYGAEGQTYGVEQYLPGRRVIWAFVGQECRYGSWYEEAGRICFVYENEPGAQCWEFYGETGGLRARFSGDPGGQELVEVQQSAEPMHCPGPDLGV